MLDQKAPDLIDPQACLSPVTRELVNLAAMAPAAVAQRDALLAERDATIDGLRARIEGLEAQLAAAQQQGGRT